MIVIANEVKQPSETLDRHAALRLATTTLWDFICYAELVEASRLYAC